MATSQKIPGKFAGRIPVDINVYDPRATSLHNPFKDPPLGFLATDKFRDPLPNNNVCNHKFTIKQEQTLVDVPSDRPNGTIKDYDRGKVGAICQRCNWHLEVKVMWPTGKEAKDICPTSENPMHFFVIMDTPTIDQSGKETYLYGCNACKTLLNITYRPPRLPHEYYDMLTDPDNLKARAEEVARREVGRTGIELQSGIKVLEALASYLTDALLGRGSKGIPAHNKRFMTSFGEDCIPLLEWLGFRKKSPDGVENPDGTGTWAEHEVWELPKVTPVANHHPFKSQDSSRIQLNDIVEELWAQIRRYPPGQLSTIKHQPPAMVDYEGAVLKLLGASHYDRATGILRGRRPVGASNAILDDEDGYTGLGISRDFSSPLVMHAFHKQVDWLPEQSAYFFDCVVAIKDRRETDPAQEMQMNVVLLMSEGYSSRADVLNAYRYLGFDDPKYADSLTDSDLLGRFDSRLQSIGRNQEAELRSQLKIIGRARGSDVLLSHSENEVTNEAGALRLLDPTYNGTVFVSDDQVIAMAVSKLFESKGNTQMEELCYKAVDVIANERNSETLKTWLITKGDNDNMLLDPAEIEFNNAKRYFEIAEGQTEIDLAVLQTLMAMKVQDDPSSELDAHKYYAVIQERLRVMEEQRLQGGWRRGVAPDYTIPVGLSNMGNTCYLNSYLQFFYAVKPLRDLVLDFNKYKIDTEDSKLAPRKVDGLTIGRADIIETEKCVLELQALFTQMSAAPGPVVDPTWRLAVLALETGPLAAQAVVSARRATVSGTDNTGLPVVVSLFHTTAAEPQAPDHSPTMGATIYGIKSATANSSEVTLIDDGSRQKTPDTDMEVHMGDANDIMMLDERQDKGKEPLDSEFDPMDPEAMPLLSKEPEEEPVSPVKVNDEPSEPQRPPPVPPRPNVNVNTRPIYGPPNRGESAAVPPLIINSDNSKNTYKMKAEAAAQQQDVDEAMGNVLFKIQCSIKGASDEESTTATVEPATSSQPSSNVIKNTFYGQFVWKYMDSKTEPMNEGFSAINVSLAEKPENVTAGLESAFAIDEVSLDGKRTRRYRTITQAPPIFQVYLQRQYFDATKGDAVINKHFIRLEEVIYLDRFMSESNTDIQGLRAKSWVMDAQLEKCLKKKAELINLVEAENTSAVAESSKNAAVQSTTFGVPTVTNNGNDTSKTKAITKTGPEIIDDTWTYISREGEVLGADEALLDGLKQQAESRRRDIVKLEAKIEELRNKKKFLFDGYKKHAYRLAAVFVHRGQGGARGGHYWIYICDFNKHKKADPKTTTEQDTVNAAAQSQESATSFQVEKLLGAVGQPEIQEDEILDSFGEPIHGRGVQWRKYEDSDVKVVSDPQEIFKERDPEKDGAPYFLVYVRDEDKDQIVDPLFRIPPPPPPPRPEELDTGFEDIEMGEVERTHQELPLTMREDEDMTGMDSDPFMGSIEFPAPPTLHVSDHSTVARGELGGKENRKGG